MNRSAFVLVFFLIATSVPCFAQHVGWHLEYEQALEEARRTSQPLLIHFKSPYCGPCLQMDRQVLHDPNVTRVLNDGIVCVVVDISRREDLASQYGVETIPRDVAVMADGRIRTLNIGKLLVFAYADLLRRLSSEGASMRRPPEIVKVTPGNEGPQSTYEQDPPAASETPVLVGLEGFCPVTLSQSREWVAGDKLIAEEYKGIKYYFSSENARSEFVKNPSRYAPQNLGCDPVVLLSAQKAVTGSIRYGAFFDNQLYLFSSLENKDEFKKSPLRFSRIRQAIRIDQIQGTRFQ